MSDRFCSIGIKQVIRLEWLEKSVSFLLAGMDAKTIRGELHDYLASRKGDGSEGGRSKQTRSFAVNNLMKIWVAPDPALVPFRDAALLLLRKHPSSALAVHWAMICAAYPFWFNVARQTGRLLNLQEQITKQQITNRILEAYGDRETVSRYSRYVIRSFVAWGVLKESNVKGCYEKTISTNLDDKLTILMIEAALLSSVDGKAALKILLSSPGFFPFKLKEISGDFIAQHNSRVDVVRYGLDDQMLVMKM